MMSTPKPYVYVLIRRDIPIAQQCVQIAHASLEAGRSLYAPDEPIASVILLEIADRAALLAAASRLTRYGIEHNMFFEPDFDMGESAIATRPVRGKERHLFKAWPLYGRAKELAHPRRAA